MSKVAIAAEKGAVVSGDAAPGRRSGMWYSSAR